MSEKKSARLRVLTANPLRAEDHKQMVLLLDKALLHDLLQTVEDNERGVAYLTTVLPREELDLVVEVYDPAKARQDAMAYYQLLVSPDYKTTHVGLL